MTIRDYAHANRELKKLLDDRVLARIREPYLDDRLLLQFSLFEPSAWSVNKYLRPYRQDENSATKSCPSD